MLILFTLLQVSELWAYFDGGVIEDGVPLRKAPYFGKIVHLF